MSYNKSELYRACLEVAEETLWDHQNLVSHEKVKSLADKFFQDADQTGELCEELCPGENPIIEVVRYLAYAHAIPPMGDDTRWFYDMLQVLMELCCPNNIYSSDAAKFFNALERGVRASMSDMDIEVDQEEKTKIDELLDQIDLDLKNKRIGAWLAFQSDNPDRLSQAANSMVELLDKVIGLICKDATLSEYLERRFESDKESKWVDTARKFIGDTKSYLHRVKHYNRYQNESMVETLLTVTERLIHLLLSPKLNFETERQNGVGKSPTRHTEGS